MDDKSLDTKLLKIKNLTSLQVIRFSLHYFGILSKMKYVSMGLIVFITVLKNYIKAEADLIKVHTKKAISIASLKNYYLKAAFFNGHWAGMNFLTDYLFEKQLTPYGGYIACKVLKNVLFTDSRMANETIGAEFDYYVTEGGKAMAKISRMVIFAFLSKLAHFWFGIRNIMKLDTTENQFASKLYIVLLLGLTSIKVYKMEKLVKFNNFIMDIAFEKEKRINETLSNTAIIKAYSQEDHMKIKYNRTAFKWEYHNISFKFWSLSTDLLYNILSVSLRPAMAMLLITLMNAKSIGSGVIRNTDVLAYMDMLHEMLITMNALIKLYSDIKIAIGLTHNLINYIQKCQKEITKKIQINTFENSIKGEGVLYAVNDKLIFAGVDFVINKGDKIALFGRNGTGKSSIFKLILGFDDCKGSIKIDGIDINRLSMSEYRSLFTFVPQDTKLFDETIFYNLTFGNNRTYKEVIEECKKMKIHDTIMTFSNGYNTQVGEGGKNINGGLRQKIFYTRAFLRDTDIYMFDEPTNNLDLINSEFLLEYMKDPKYSEKTFFVITHELKIVREFPKIFHFDEGKINIVETV